MSISKAQEFYQSLTTQQKHFVDNKTINTTLSIKHWLAFLSKASAYDEYGDIAIRTLKLRSLLFIVCLVISVIISFASGVYYLFILTAIFAVLTFNTIQKAKTFGSRDINNYLRLFFVPFVEAIGKKAGEDAKLSAALDFRDPFKALTPTKSEMTAFGRKRDVAVYEPKLIIAGVTLADGSFMETVLVDEIKKMSWRNANGKSKSKSKTLHRLFIRLSVAKDQYRLKSTSMPANVEFSEDDAYYILKLKQKEKELIEGILKPSVFFANLASLYFLFDPMPGTIPSIEGQALPSAPALVPNLAEAMVWNDLLFNEYDHDGVMRRRDSTFSDDDNTQNIFDS